MPSPSFLGSPLLTSATLFFKMNGRKERQQKENYLRRIENVCTIGTLDSSIAATVAAVVVASMCVRLCVYVRRKENERRQTRNGECEQRRNRAKTTKTGMSTSVGVMIRKAWELWQKWSDNEKGA